MSFDKLFAPEALVFVVGGLAPGGGGGGGAPEEVECDYGVQ